MLWASKKISYCLNVYGPPNVQDLVTTGTLKPDRVMVGVYLNATYETVRISQWPTTLSL